MKKIHFVLLLGVPVIGWLISASIAFAQTPAPQPVLKTVASIDATRMAESIQFYKQMHAVLSHPRRVNCHPRNDTANLNRHVHTPSVTRDPETAGRQRRHM